MLAIWEWTTDSDKPLCTAELDPKFGPQTNICFNLENTFQIVTNSHHQTIFYEWSHDGGFVYFAPQLDDNVNFNFILYFILLQTNGELNFNESFFILIIKKLIFFSIFWSIY